MFWGCKAGLCLTRPGPSLLSPQTRVRDALRNVEAISRLGNQYIQLMQPWKLAKDPQYVNTIVWIEVGRTTRAVLTAVLYVSSIVRRSYFSFFGGEDQSLV
jgi:methionyl-tRNA synthetase